MIYEGGLVGLAYNPFSQEWIGVATASGTASSPAASSTPTSCTSASTCSSSTGWASCWSPRWAGAGSCSCTSWPCWAAAFGVLLIDPNHFTVGASGAVFGIMGAAVAVFRARGVNIMDSGLGATIFLNLALTFIVPGISIGGHVGGLVTGYVAGEMLMSIGPQFLKDQRLAVASVVVLGRAVAVGSIIVA